MEKDFFDDEMDELPPNTLIQIPEEILEQSAFVLSQEGGNNVFIEILKAGEEYKKAGMTPIYLYDMFSMNIKLITAETFGKKLH